MEWLVYIGGDTSENFLTINKSYEVVHEYNILDGEYIYVENDNAVMFSYNKKFFKALSDIRAERINDILDI